MDKFPNTVVRFAKNKVFMLTIKHDPEVDSEVVLFNRQLTETEEKKIKAKILKYKKQHEEDGDFEASDMLDEVIYKPFKDIVITVDGWNWVDAQSRC